MIRPPKFVFYFILWWKRVVNWRGAMLGCYCLNWDIITESLPSELRTFSLPAPIPEWPPGKGFGSGIVSLGKLEVFRICKFEYVWSCNFTRDVTKGVAFYKPVEIPEGFHILGHCCQLTDRPIRCYSLVARELQHDEGTDQTTGSRSHGDHELPALIYPLDYALIWSLHDGSDEKFSGAGYFWLPQPPEGYKALGYLVTKDPEKPKLDEVKCVREDLTDKSELHQLMLDVTPKVTNLPFRVWSTRPYHRGMWQKGVSVGTFYCSSFWEDIGEEVDLVCLKNFDHLFSAMPNLDQIHALIKHYGPTVFFHPKEVYLPSSVSWFFSNGALLYRKGESTGEAIDADGSNLPVGGSNDGEFWIDLTKDERRKTIIYGNLESSKLYVHVKPAVGGIFTDIAMWVFCPFNGPATLKVGVGISLGKIGQHVCDWEHFTLRICNCTGELWSIYFSQHSGGEWVDAPDLEYLEGNKVIVYSTRHGHASFPHPGTYIQGSSKLGLGIRNDAARSDLYVHSSIKYEIVAAEYLGEGVVDEPRWLQFMREWGPTIVYNSKTELDRVLKVLPWKLRPSVENIFNKLPNELCREEGPSGPKEKNNWEGDERW